MRKGQGRARLVYNAGAGRAGGLMVDDLLRALAEAGFMPVHDPTATEAELDRLLDNPVDLVVAAGGDGTVRAVATRLIGRDIPLAIVPLGTANNVAAALGVHPAPPVEVLKGLRRANRRNLDVGVVKGPWGQDYFLESAGVGIFAELLHAYSPEQGRSLLRAMKSAVSVMAGYHAREARLALDDVGFSGRYLLVEAMNTPYLGMRNRLAPEADPTDGRLDVVLVPEDERFGLAAFITQAVAGKVASMPNVTVRQAQRLRLEWDGVPIHGDEAVRVGDDAGASPTVPVEIEILRGALEVWTPAVHAVPVS